MKTTNCPLSVKNRALVIWESVMKDGILFIDVEWNRFYQGECKADGIVEIGAVSNIDAEDCLFYYLKPEVIIPNKILSFLNVTMLFLENRGVSKDKALPEFDKLIRSYEQVVVWSEDTLGLLSDIMSEDVFECTKICILQDFLAAKHGKKLSYERALKTYEIEYNPISLHNSEYDAKCLMNLYAKADESYKVVPFEHIHRLKGKALNQYRIEKLLNYFKCNYELSDNHVTVRTQCSDWSIYFNAGMVKSLYHENHKSPRGKHNHKLPYRDFYTVLKYILSHDERSICEDKVELYERSNRIRMAQKKRQKERRLVDEKPIKQNGKYFEYYEAE